MEKPNPEAIKWITAEQPLFEYVLKLLMPDNPVSRSIESLPKDFPEGDIDALMMLAMDQWPDVSKQNFERNLNMYIDFDYLTNGKGYSKNEAYGVLANEYGLTEDTIKRQVQKFLPS